LPEQESTKGLNRVSNLFIGTIILGVTDKHQPTFPIEINPFGVIPSIVLGKRNIKTKVMMRTVGNNAISIRDSSKTDVSISVSHNPQQANLELHPECTSATGTSVYFSHH
jgi:hypothetical protein